MASVTDTYTNELLLSRRCRGLHNVLLLHKSFLFSQTQTTSDSYPFITHPYILKMSANGTAINLDQRSYAFFSLLTFHSDAY